MTTKVVTGGFFCVNSQYKSEASMMLRVNWIQGWEFFGLKILTTLISEHHGLLFSKLQLCLDEGS